MMSCRQVSRLISESEVRKLSLMERMQLSFHLMMCKLCSNFKKQMDFLKKISTQLLSQQESDESIQLNDEGRSRIQKSLQDEISSIDSNK